MEGGNGSAYIGKANTLMEISGRFLPVFHWPELSYLDCRQNLNSVGEKAQENQYRRGVLGHTYLVRLF